MEKVKKISILSIRCIIFIIVTSVLCCFNNKSLEENSKWWTLIMNICNIITILILLYMCKRKSITYSKLIKFNSVKISKRKIITYTFFIVIIGLLGVYFSGYIFFKQIPYNSELLMQPIPLGLAILNIFILPITTTIAEEGLYLGIGVNNKKDILIPIFFYVIQHCFIPFVLDIRFILYRFVSFIPVLSFMCIYYYKKQEILPIMLGHFIINLATTIQILLISV